MIHMVTVWICTPAGANVVELHLIRSRLQTFDAYTRHVADKLPLQGYLPLHLPLRHQRLFILVGRDP